MIGLGMVAILSQALLPSLLGQLGHARMLSQAGIGEAAAIESYALTLTAGVAGLVLPPRRLRPIAAIGGAILVAANLYLATRASEPFILASRGIAGAAEGLLFWIALEAVARSRLAERAAGLLNVGALCAGLAAVNLLNGVLLPRFGIPSAFLLLAAMSGSAILLSARIPPRLNERPDDVRVVPRPAGWLALLAVGLFNAAGMGFAIYIMPLAADKGITIDLAGRAASALLGGQLAGSLVAIVLAGRVAPFLVLAGSILAYGTTWPFYATALSGSSFVLLSGALGLVTFLAFPFQFPFAAAVDPGTRCEVLTGPACMLGSSTGPLLSAWAVDGFGLRGLLYMAFALLTPSALLFVALRAGAFGSAFDRAAARHDPNL